MHNVPDVFPPAPPRRVQHFTRRRGQRSPSTSLASAPSVTSVNHGSAHRVMRPSAWKEDRRLPIYGRLPCRRCRSRMCRVPAIGSLRSFGWCRVDTSVLLVACSLSPWPARRLSPFSFFIFLCRISLPTTSTSPTIWTGCCSAWPSRRLLGSYCGAWAGAVKGVQALRARIRFSRLLRQPSDPRTATVAASKRGGRTLILDTNPGGYQPLSEVRLA